MNKSVRASAPATVANVSCGFDIFGLALEAPADEVIITLTDSPEVIVSKIEGDQGRLPKESHKNTSSVAVKAYLEAIKSDNGATIELYKKLPLGSGLGSSAASAAAALVAINYLYDNPLSRMELLPFAMEAERVACGSAHADNVAPSLLGGFVLIRSYSPLDVVNIPTPLDLYFTLIHPHLELKTEDSRRILRANVPMKDAITQWGNVAGLVAGLMKSDYALIGRSLVDVVAEPSRSVLIPGFDSIKTMASHNGALGCGISGSGPTLFTVCQDRTLAEKIGKHAQAIFKGCSLESDIYVSQINPEGAKVLL